MNKKFMVVGAGLLVAGGLAILALYFYWLRPVESAAPTYQQLAEHAASHGVVLPPPPPSAPQLARAAAPIDPKKPVRLAIGWLGLPDETQNGQAADLLLAQLSSARNLQLVDRQSLDKVLRESQMSLSGLVRAQSAMRFGKLLRADWFLLGSAATVNGSNYVVVRIVDARTGTMLNAEIVSRQDGTSQLVPKLAAFVRQSRESASHPAKPRTYLAIGGFKDVSMNNRQADFPARLRGYLTAAFHDHTNVTLLEREFVDLLHQEMQLDLAGLTEEGLTNSVQPMQAAFWLVDGLYQSYEVSGFDVEVVLRVHRMYGPSITDLLRGPPEESFFSQIKSRIELAMTRQADLLFAPTHYSEIQAQLELARQLSKSSVRRAGSPERGASWGDEQVDNLERRNLEEAIQAYETVLVLDPENHEAKMGLASCLQHPLIGKETEARNFVREVAESTVSDKWNLRAMVALGEYYRYEDPAQAVEWFKRAAAYSKIHPVPPGSSIMVNGFNLPLYNGLPDFLQVAGVITAEMQAAAHAARDRRNYPESLLFEGTRKMESLYSRYSGRSLDPGAGFGIESFVKSFGTNRATAVGQLNELLPDLQKEFPVLAPDLLAIALTYQLDTNSTVVSNFVQSVERYSEHPDEVPIKHYYFTRLSRDCYNWCMANKMYALALRLVEVKHRVQMTKAGVDSSFGVEAGVYDQRPVLSDPEPVFREDTMRVIYASMALERWQDALRLLEGVSSQPFPVAGPGPWGKAVIPTELIAQCREKLGLPVKRDPRVFQLGEPWWSFGDPGVFTTDQDSLWIAVCCKLWKVSLDTKTNTAIALPKDPDSRITVLCSEPSRLWIGTTGDGLIEYDKQSHESKKYTEKDGLLMNDISAVCPQGDVLWLGFDGFNRGGFGRLDLRTGRATAFTPSLRPGDSKGGEPPTAGIEGIVALRPDELLFSFGWLGLARMREYHVKENSWETLQWTPTGLAFDSQRLVVGLAENYLTDKSLKGVGILAQNLADSQMEKIGSSSGLPNLQTQAVALDGNDLWVGGAGFIGVMDIHKQVLRKFCYIRSSHVDHIEVAGNYAWVLMDRSIYRIPLSETR